MELIKAMFSHSSKYLYGIKIGKYNVCLLFIVSCYCYFQIHLKDKDTDESFSFFFDRWLSRTHDDFDISRELAVSDEKKQPLLPSKKLHTYCIIYLHDNLDITSRNV